MLKLILLAVLMAVIILALFILLSPGKKKEVQAPVKETDPSVLVRMRTAPGIGPKAAIEEIVVPDYDGEEEPHIEPNRWEYEDLTPEAFREPSMTDLLLDNNVPIDKKRALAEELERLGYVVKIKIDVEDGVPAGEREPQVSEMPSEEEAFFQKEDAEDHPELSVPEEKDELKEAYDKAETLLQTTKAPSVDFSMFEESDKPEAEGEGSDPLAEMPGEAADGEVKTIYPSEDMSNDIGWDNV